MRRWRSSPRPVTRGSTLSSTQWTPNVDRRAGRSEQVRRRQTWSRADRRGDLDLLQRLQEARAGSRRRGQFQGRPSGGISSRSPPKLSRHPSRDGVSEGDRRKVIIFSAYTDTIQNLRELVVEAIEAAPPGPPLANYGERVAPAVFGSKTGIDPGGRAHTARRVHAGNVRPAATRVSSSILDKEAVTTCSSRPMCSPKAWTFSSRPGAL